MRTAAVTPNALLVGALAGTLAAVAAFVALDALAPGFYLYAHPRLILIPLLVAAGQTLLLGLPALAVLRRLGRLNAAGWVLAGAVCAALPWGLLLLGTPALAVRTFLWLALCGAIGGLVGHLTARVLAPAHAPSPAPPRAAG